MPGGDGTGPMGMGPMTGGGRGYCVMPEGGYFGRGRGSGRGRGQGRGWRRAQFGYGAARGYRYGVDPYYGLPNAPEFTAQQETEMLRKEAISTLVIF